MTTTRAAPDATFTAMRGAATRRLAASAPGWTDHNLHDPGITLLEAALFALADLHYRIATRRFDHWPLEVAPLAAAGPLTVPVVSAADLALIAEALAGRRQELIDAVAAAGSLSDAALALSRIVLDPGPPEVRLGIDGARAAALLLRAPAYQRLALDRHGHIDGALADLEAAAVPPVDRPARLRTVLPELWPEEAEDLVATAGRDRLVAAAAAWPEAEQAALDLEPAPGVVAAALGERFGPGAPQRELISLLPFPRSASPESFEAAGGATLVWPPTAAQARTVEPVVAGDYARLARALPGVARAWVRLGVLRGVDWRGALVATPDENRQGALTIVVDPVPAVAVPLPTTPTAALTPRQRDYLRHVLAAALASGAPAELAAPYTVSSADLDALSPRRLIGDEVGAALLRACPVTVRGVLYVSPDTTRDAALEAAEDAITAFFAAGRPRDEPLVDLPAGAAGPWPVDVLEPPGWVPGDAVRMNEIVQLLVEAVPGVLGTEDVAGKLAGGPWQSDEVELAGDCVPVLADPLCLRVRFDTDDGATCDA